MTTLVLAALLSVVQANPPTPGQTPHSATRAGNKVKKNAVSNQASAAPATASLDANKAKTDEKPGNQPPIPNSEQSVRIRELPTVSVARDWADWTVWAFTGGLAVGGIVGIVFAYRTLKIIKKQTDLQRAAMEQWIDVDELEVYKYIQPNATKSDFPITFRLGNPTKFPLTLQSVIMWVDRRQVQTVFFRNLLLSPDKSTTVTVPWHIEGVKLANYRANHLLFEFGGVVSFVDVFKDKREQKFGFICNCRPANTGDFTLSAFTPPDEEELKAQQKAQRPNPN